MAGWLRLWGARCWKKDAGFHPGEVGGLATVALVRFGRQHRLPALVADLAKETPYAVLRLGERTLGDRPVLLQDRRARLVSVPDNLFDFMVQPRGRHQAATTNLGRPCCAGASIHQLFAMCLQFPQMLRRIDISVHQSSGLSLGQHFAKSIARIAFADFAPQRSA